MEKGFGHEPMTAAVPFHGNGQPAPPVWLVGVFLLLPALLAAGTLENPLNHSSIPDENSYRSPLSETLLESNSWRIPQEEKQDWRLPPPLRLPWVGAPLKHPNPKHPTKNVRLNCFPDTNPANNLTMMLMNGKKSR